MPVNHNILVEKHQIYGTCFFRASLSTKSLLMPGPRTHNSLLIHDAPSTGLNRLRTAADGLVSRGMHQA